MASRCMLLTMKSRCQNTCFNEKRPKLVQETSRTMVFKARSKNILEFWKKKLFTIIVTLKMTIKKYFFVKKTCQKNLPTTLVKKICEKKNWKSTFFYQKYFLMVILRVTIMVNKFFFEIQKKNWDRALKNIVPDCSWLSSGLFPKKQVIWHIDYQ